MKNPIYARDIASELRNDTFLGKGFEEIQKKAEKEGKEVIVGYYLEKAKVEA